MRITSRDRLDYKSTLADTRLSGRSLYAAIPTVTKTSFDEDTQSAYDVSSGLGETYAWKVIEFIANTRNVEESLRTFGQVPPGAEIGDVFFSVDTRLKAVMEAVQNAESAYISIDGSFFRPTGILAAGVGQVEEWVVTVKAYYPLVRAPGL